MRDGEAILRLQRKGYFVAPLSRNKTKSAHRRMEMLGLELEGLGVDDKVSVLKRIVSRLGVSLEETCFVGDGQDDAEVVAAVGLGLAVGDAHPAALRAADLVLKQEGGNRVMEAIETLLEETG